MRFWGKMGNWRKVHPCRTCRTCSTLSLRKPFDRPGGGPAVCNRGYDSSQPSLRLKTFNHLTIHPFNLLTIQPFNHLTIQPFQPFHYLKCNKVKACIIALLHYCTNPGASYKVLSPLFWLFGFGYYWSEPPAFSPKWRSGGVAKWRSGGVAEIEKETAAMFWW